MSAKPGSDRFGFSTEQGGAHIARTMMLSELTAILDAVPDPAASRDAYRRAVVDENCLQKRSGRSRLLTLRHLADLYALDPQVPLFRTLRFFWQRDPLGHPLLALLCAYARDPVLRLSAPHVLDCTIGSTLMRADMEEYIESVAPDRFSPATLRSVAQNVNGTWTSSGHLAGHVNKRRSQAQATPGAAVYALYLGYLRGTRNLALFTTEYARLLDCSPERTLELAGEATRRGWIVLKEIGTVVDVQFPDLLTPDERECLREQDQTAA